MHTPAATDTSKNSKSRPIVTRRVVEEDSKLSVLVAAIHSHTVPKSRRQSHLPTGRESPLAPTRLWGRRLTQPAGVTTVHGRC